MLAPALNETNFPYEKKSGKVRDTYFLDDRVFMITTDRLSAFDRPITDVPFKGQVLTQISAWWFIKMREIMPNHFLSMPDPNVIVAKKCSVFPIEFVVRGYITGTTKTSLWTLYQQGEREFCGTILEEGLQNNQKLQQPLLTPTTKSETHDAAITPEEIITRGLMTKEQWQYCSEKALALFRFGAEEVKQRGLILVDTKYEFGVDSESNILLIDEVHTPDSSRYWALDSYEERFSQF